MYADALLSLAAASLLLVVFYGPWQDLCTDWARQIIFESRDCLFDLARSGELSFDSDEYRTIRGSLEGLIRFAHDLTLMRFIILAAVTKGNSKSDLRDTIYKIKDRATQQKVMALTDRAHNAIWIMLGCKSLIGLFVMFLAVLIKPLRKSLALHAKIYEDDIQREAEIEAVSQVPICAIS
jgi:hypothetical protein